MDPSAGRDFFISYTGVNRSWAEWIAVQLEGAGYSTVLQAFDFAPGTDFVHQMQVATGTAARTIAVLVASCMSCTKSTPGRKSNACSSVLYPAPSSWTATHSAHGRFTPV